MLRARPQIVTATILLTVFAVACAKRPGFDKPQTSLADVSGTYEGEKPATDSKHPEIDTLSYSEYSIVNGKLLFQKMKDDGSTMESTLEVGDIKAGKGRSFELTPNSAMGTSQADESLKKAASDFWMWSNGEKVRVLFEQDKTLVMTNSRGQSRRYKHTPEQTALNARTKITQKIGFRRAQISKILQAMQGHALKLNKWIVFDVPQPKPQDPATPPATTAPAAPETMANQNVDADLGAIEREPQSVEAAAPAKKPLVKTAAGTTRATAPAPKPPAPKPSETPIDAKDIADTKCEGDGAGAKNCVVRLKDVIFMNGKEPGQILAKVNGKYQGVVSFVMIREGMGLPKTKDEQDADPSDTNRQFLIKLQITLDLDKEKFNIEETNKGMYGIVILGKDAKTMKIVIGDRRKKTVTQVFDINATTEPTVEVPKKDGDVVPAAPAAQPNEPKTDGTPL